MVEAIRAMMDKRRPADQAGWDRALREVIQETALAGLWRTHFFDKAAFYGGTALRLFHGLDRFSEDLDFTLVKADPAWRLEERLEGLRSEIEAFGFTVSVQSKNEGAIESAFIKANTRIHLIRIEAPKAISGSFESNQLVRVKLEVDTDPPSGIRSEVKTLFEPFPVSIRVVTPPCLFAGKLHACICRRWKTRVKGRDWYDLLYFIGKGIQADLQHLEARLRQSGHLTGPGLFSPEDARRLLQEKIQTISWTQAAEDVVPFIRDPRSTGLWGAKLFMEAVERIEYT